MVRIGTRGSELALWQARHVQARLGGEAAGVTLDIIKTTGDRMLDIPLQNQLDKGFFTKELEVALLADRVDAAVHSLKDLPTQLPDGLTLAAVPMRAAVEDLLLVRPEAVDLSRPLPLKAGARVGTASMRRMALLKHLAPDVEATFLRGNVPTRLGKAQKGELDAVILARAGVSRLGLDPGDLVVFDLNPRLWLPAAAQGALGLEARGQDAATLARLATLHHIPTAAAVDVERGLLRRMEGGCHSAFGAFAEIDDKGHGVLRAGIGDDRGWHHIEVSGAVGTLVEAAYEAMQAALAGLRHPAIRLDASGDDWHQHAHSWPITKG